MRLLRPSFEILGNLDFSKDLALLESAGRVCYKSEKKITPDSSHKFIKGIIKSGHETVIEHRIVSVRIICDRGVSHELVRHRIASFSQESTHYCDYSKGDISFIIPAWVDIDTGVHVDRLPLIKAEKSLADVRWFDAMLEAEDNYKGLRDLGWTQKHARSVLPNSLKTELVMTANYREWRHFFKLRALGTTGTPHPQMSEISRPMLKEFKRLIPVIFDDLELPK